MEWMKWLWAIALGLMLISIWPAWKRWQANKIEAQPEDWSTATFILGLVMLFVLLLVVSVQ